VERGGTIRESGTPVATQPPSSVVPRPSSLVPLLVAIATFVAFLPALRNGFVAWDDDKNFLANPHYRGLGWIQLRWMWTTFHLGHYVPLSWMTLGLDYVLWGMNPLGYHLTNIVLHVANAVLVYVLARRILQLSGAAPSEDRERSLAAFAALVFALHPLRVESVAWVTERRDVLSGFFYLSTVLLYLRAATQPARFVRWYVLALLSFVCALLSKATSVTVPVVLLILTVYPLHRISASMVRSPRSALRSRAVLDLIPFALLSAATAVLSIVALHAPTQLDTPAKVAVSAYSIVFYLWKTVVPAGLSPIYEMPQRVDHLGPRIIKT
jgi:hypothetical protein